MASRVATVLCIFACVAHARRLEQVIARSANSVARQHSTAEQCPPEDTTECRLLVTKTGIELSELTSFCEQSGFQVDILSNISVCMINFNDDFAACCGTRVNFIDLGFTVDFDAPVYPANGGQ
mmetsp:Transcript_28907/g.76272  ORF Transcript_28907/g.76272 Transcript_28907/m.76272 type:complete len:123 (-) Transcript_28907:235-603(-)